MTKSFQKSAIIFLAFVAIFFIIAFSWNARYPMLVIAGENSATTWMSGALLIAAATLSGVTALREGWFPWIVLAAFLFMLAVDERFMIHEGLKNRIAFSTRDDPSTFVNELPVIGGAVVGLVIAIVLFRVLDRTGRIMLVIAVALGLISVVWDVFSLGVIPEDLCKLLAEVALVLAMINKVSR